MDLNIQNAVLTSFLYRKDMEISPFGLDTIELKKRYIGGMG